MEAPRTSGFFVFASGALPIRCRQLPCDVQGEPTAMNDGRWTILTGRRVAEGRERMSDPRVLFCGPCICLMQKGRHVTFSSAGVILLGDGVVVGDCKSLEGSMFCTSFLGTSSASLARLSSCLCLEPLGGLPSSHSQGKLPGNAVLDCIANSLIALRGSRYGPARRNMSTLATVGSRGVCA
jgi:hypothetical protein